MPLITENFGLIPSTSEEANKEENKALVLTDGEYKKLQDGFG